MKLHISIITPQKITHVADADELIVPTTAGEITILPNHLPIVTQLSHGQLIIKNGNNTDHLAVEGGFLQVSDNKVSVLADYAIHGKDISLEEAEQAKKRAEKALQEKGLEEKDLETLQTELRRAILELKVASKAKHRI